MTEQNAHTLDISDALADLDLADEVELDCGKFDIVIRQASTANDDFRAAVARRSLVARKKKLAPEQGSLTGSFEQDVRLFIEAIIVGWGDRPLKDNSGNVVPCNEVNLFKMFTGSRAGKVLFSKIQLAAVDDSLFVQAETDLGNS